MAHRQLSPSTDPDAVDDFLRALAEEDEARALELIHAQPDLAATSVHVAAALGRAEDVRRLLGEDGDRVRERAGEHGGEPLYWLCASPFHGESPERDRGLADAAKVLLEGGADVDTRAGPYELPALYFVTGHREVPEMARLLLEAGAAPTDGESVFHAAEHFHRSALEILLEFGVDLNQVGDWGNTPLYFLLRHHDVERQERTKSGVIWLLDHGADPNVRCGTEEETALHVAVRRDQSPSVVRMLLDHGADVHARRGDGRTAWVLAQRGAQDELATVLVGGGATSEELSPADLLVAACSRGDANTAREVATHEVLEALAAADLRVLPDAAARGRLESVRACLAVGFDVDARDDYGATALHHACIRGDAKMVRELLERDADHTIRDAQHQSTPVGWVTFGADYVSAPEGDYVTCLRMLLDAGARPDPNEHPPAHAELREMLRSRS